MVTLLMGHNDICSRTCQNSTEEAVNHIMENIVQALDTLQELPRTFVNLMAISGKRVNIVNVTCKSGKYVAPHFIPDLAEIFEIRTKPLCCQISHKFECPCVFQGLIGIHRPRTYTRADLYDILNR